MADTSNLRNEDFRKLLSAPKKLVGEVASVRDAAGDTAHSFTHRHQPKQEKKEVEKAERDDDESNLKEILKNYRDRALERRQKGTERQILSVKLFYSRMNSIFSITIKDADEAAKLAAAYRAVPGDARAVTDKANLRKQAIEVKKSQFLFLPLDFWKLIEYFEFFRSRNTLEEIWNILI
uniref:RED_N domain-containing protein n=1 Tax=Heterorhabditis bacteriophora TaxID=37862 RepID=A0A1I7X315_HETBA